MSRSGLCEYDGDDQWAFIRHRGAVRSAIRGARGQKLLRELLAALEAMPERRLIADDWESEDGEACALIVLGRARGVDLTAVDPEDPDAISNVLDVAPVLIQEILWMNDDDARYSSPEQRWKLVHNWVERHVVGLKQMARTSWPHDDMGSPA